MLYLLVRGQSELVETTYSFSCLNCKNPNKANSRPNPKKHPHTRESDQGCTVPPH